MGVIMFKFSSTKVSYGKYCRLTGYIQKNREYQFDSLLK
jgi:hypothetical protein